MISDNYDWKLLPNGGFRARLQMPQDIVVCPQLLETQATQEVKQLAEIDSRVQSEQDLEHRAEIFAALGAVQDK